MARRLAEDGAQVRAVSLSAEQLDWARTHNAPSFSPPSYELTDYRALTGSYDAIVSVEMIEGSPATIESVRILRIRLPSNGTVVGDEVTPGPSSGRATEDIPVGVRLEVTPAIRGGTRVLLRIRAKSSNLGAPLPPDDIPEELSRMVDAEILVENGETAVLGGLQRESGQDSGAGLPGSGRQY